MVSTAEECADELLLSPQEKLDTKGGVISKTLKKLDFSQHSASRVLHLCLGHVLGTYFGWLFSVLPSGLILRCSSMHFSSSLKRVCLYEIMCTKMLS